MIFVFIFVLIFSQVLGNATGWQYIVGFSFFPAVLQLFMLLPCPRSPRYLLLKLNEEAEAVQGTNPISYSNN